ncbi:MAG: 4-hydroxy-tetrahydrodipicolinate reductase [Gemmatimonadetes bacterium]|nr:4-hydroxy-tetrahydrodipicolinate reductase [Gemmatimonadota bacterium]
MKLALFGYGRMGRAVEEVAKERGHQITAILDEFSSPGGSGITAESMDGARVAVDFSTAVAVLPNVCKAAALGVSVVVGTTGWDDDRAAVEACVRKAGTGLLHAPNFSVGMFLFTRLAETAAGLANTMEGYDVHLFEEHHRHKVDHPGGTARGLADLLVRGLDSKDGWTELTPGVAPDPRLLQLSVARVGENPGMHEIVLDGPDDRIVLRHEAKNRAGFARGAVLAAEWLENRTGIYTMADLMGQI